MNDLLIDNMYIGELAQVDSLSRSDHLDLGGVRGRVVKGDDHTAGYVQELAVDLQDASSHGHVLLETMGRSTVLHQRAAEPDEIPLAREQLGDMDGDADLILQPGFGPAFAARAGDGTTAPRALEHRNGRAGRVLGRRDGERGAGLARGFFVPLSLSLRLFPARVRREAPAADLPKTALAGVAISAAGIVAARRLVV